MRIRNDEKDFNLSFDGKEYEIPKGVFKVTDKLGYFIIKKTNQWGYKVEIIENEDKPLIVKEEVGKSENGKLEEKEITEPVKEVNLNETTPGLTTDKLSGVRRM